MTGAAVPGQLRRGPAVTMGHSVLSGVVEGGDHKAGRARPAGRARLRDVINSRLEEISFRAAPMSTSAVAEAVRAARKLISSSLELMTSRSRARPAGRA